MSTEENKAIVRRYLEEVIHHGNVDAVDLSIATNHVLHWPGSPNPVSPVTRPPTICTAVYSG